MATRGKTFTREQLRKAVIHFEDDDQTVYEEVGSELARASRLVCSCSEYKRTKPGEAAFCKHLQIVLVNNSDAPGVNVAHGVEVVIFHKPALVANVLLEYVQVTMEGSHPYPPDGSSLRQAYVTVPSDDPGTYDVEFMGFVYPGQGRMSLRTMILDWLIGEGCKPFPKCDSALHPSGLPYEGESFAPQRRDDLVNLFDLIVTGRCRFCNENSGIPDVL